LRGAQLASLDGSGDDFADVGLDDGGLAGVYEVDFCPSPVHPYHFMPVLREASCGHRADVA
jgi:hypothetical protein